MSVQSEITRIESARDDIASAIKEQGVTVPTGTKIAGLADLVRAITGKVTSVAGRTGDVTLTSDDITDKFTAATTRANIATGEKLSTSLGKLAKWYTDLKTVAFSGSYADLTNKPTSLPNPSALSIKAGSTGNYTTTTYTGASAATIDITPAGTGARRFEIQVLATDWKLVSGKYVAQSSAYGVTEDTVLCGIGLVPALVGNAAAEEAMRQWTYLDTGLGSVTFYADTQIKTNFAIVAITANT